jgi:hypothetical protein
MGVTVRRQERERKRKTERERERQKEREREREDDLQYREVKRWGACGERGRERG